MNNFTFFTYFLHNILTKRNIILIISMIILNTIIFFSFTFLKNTIDTKTYFEKYYTKDLNIEVYEEMPQSNDYNIIDKYLYEPESSEQIEKLYSKLSTYTHVYSSYPTKYNKEVTLGFQNNKENYITLKAIFKNENVKLVDGQYPKENEIICPTSFYPYQLNTSFLNLETMNTNNIIKTKDILNSYLNLIEYRLETGLLDKDKPNIIENNMNLKIVGTYDNKYSLDNMNTCYTALSTYKNIDDCKAYNRIKLDGQTTSRCEYYKGVVLTVDSHENVQELINKLSDEGYHTFIQGSVKIISEAYIYPIAISIITIITSIIILILFIRKKIINKKQKLSLLKIQGFKDHIIIKYEIIDNIVIYFISFIITVIIFNVLLIILEKTLLSAYLYNGFILKPSFILIMLLLLFELSIISILTITNINKIIKNDFINNLGDN